MPTSNPHRDPNADAALIERLLDPVARASKRERRWSELASLEDEDVRSALGAVSAWRRESAGASTAPTRARRGRLIRLLPYAAAAAAAALLVVVGLRLWGPTQQPHEIDDGNVPLVNTDNGGAEPDDRTPALPQNQMWGPFREVVFATEDNDHTSTTAPWGGRITIERATDEVRLVSVDNQALGDAPIQTVADPSSAARGLEQAATAGAQVPANTSVLVGQGEVTLSLQTPRGRRLTFTQHHGTLTVDHRGLVVAGGLALVQGQQLETVDDLPLFGAAGLDVVQVVEVVPSESLWLIVQGSFAQEPFVQVCEGKARVTTVAAGVQQGLSAVLAQETLTSGQRRSGVVSTTMIGDPRDSLPGWAIPSWALTSPNLDVPFAPVSWRAQFGSMTATGAFTGELVEGPHISGKVWRVPHMECSPTVTHVHGRLDADAFGPLAITSRATIAMRVYVEHPVRTLTIWFYSANGSGSAAGATRRLFVQRANVPVQEWCSLMFDASELHETPRNVLATRADLSAPVEIDRIDVTSNHCNTDPGCYIANIAIYERRD